MTKFKVGDRVRRINGSHPSGHFPVGREGIVTSFREGANRFVLDNDNKCSHDPDYLELTCGDSPSPVRTVTRKEIVSGVYGRVVVSPHAATSVTHVGVALEPTIGEGFAALNASELRAAARVLNSLAEALEEDP